VALVRISRIHYYNLKLNFDVSGVTWEAIDTLSHNAPRVALKFEDVRIKTPALNQEWLFYRTLIARNGNRRLHGVPLVYGIFYTSCYHALVMDLLGPSIESIKRARPKNQFSVQEVLQFAKQAVRSRFATSL
jgi:hypothetical protein